MEGRVLDSVCRDVYKVYFPGLNRNQFRDLVESAEKSDILPRSLLRSYIRGERVKSVYLIAELFPWSESRYGVAFWRDYSHRIPEFARSKWKIVSNGNLTLYTKKLGSRTLRIESREESITAKVGRHRFSSTNYEEVLTWMQVTCERWIYGED